MSQATDHTPPGPLPDDPAALWRLLRPGPDGLVAAVVQDDASGAVLMLGHMNAEALARTLQTGRVTFWSRSRGTLWEKGETSGHTLELRGIWVDCDADALLVRAAPRGPTCHTGAPSCFFRPVGDDRPPASVEPVFERVEAVIAERKAGRGATNRDGKSYVRGLLDGGAPAIAAKLAEEAGELSEALAEGDRGHIAREAADLIFHALVGLALRDVALAEVAEVLRARFGRSGIDEKAARPPRRG